MIRLTDAGWFEDVLASLSYQGFAVVSKVLSDDLMRRTRAAMYRAQTVIVDEIGNDRLRRAGEIGVLRIPFLFDPVFFEYLELEPVLRVVDATVGDTAVMHLLNAFILPSVDPDTTGPTFQQSFHRDFPRYLNGYVASVNAFFAIDAFTVENGATVVVPGTHQRPEAPDTAYMSAHAHPVVAEAGSLLFFDSTLWHAAGNNRSGHDRLALNMQFTKAFIKPQIDYSRALGESSILGLPGRSQQLLGWYTRVVSSLDEYYRPEAERLYRRGQG
jgi:ectoine hydroxylase-related dioxygenase (phytanoyl-CoA dioxygenase family)